MPEILSNDYGCLIIFVFIVILIFFLIERILAKALYVCYVFSEKRQRIESLLTDLRDGTRNHFIEKRLYPRFKLADALSARLNKSTSWDLIKVLNISSGGAFLKTILPFNVGETVDISICLPFFPQPIRVDAQVVWICPKHDNKGVGIEFIKMSDKDSSKLKETIRLLAT